jgi:geranylgeranyl reductase
MLIKRYAIPDLLIKHRAKGVIFQAPSGLRVPTEFPRGEFIATVDRLEFDSHLRWSAEDVGVIMVEGRVLGYDEKGNKVLVRYRGPDGNVRTTEADYIVAADGAYSRVTNQAMGQTLPMVIAMQEIIKPEPDRLASLGDNCLFNYSPAVSPDFYGWIFPKGERVSVGVGTSLENRSNLNVYLERMKELHADFLDGGETLQRNGALIPAGQYKQFGKRRVLLAGDAAGLVLPACGEGIYFAMRSGEIAAEVIHNLGEKRPDILISKYTDAVNVEFIPIFNYFKKIERITYSTPANREVFVRLARDKFMARKILSAFTTKERRRTPVFRKIAVMFKLIGIRLKVAFSISRKPEFGK